MATNAKKYYWLKLKEDFFRDKRIKKLRRLAGGDTYTIIYQKMQLLSLRKEGKLYFEGVEENFVDELALEIDEEPDNVKMTVAFLVSNGLLEEVNVDEYMLPQAVESMGSESTSAERMRRHRAKKKTPLPPPENTPALPEGNNEVSQSDAPVTKSDTELELETELEKEKEKEKETDKQTEEELSDEDKDHIELIKNLFAGWRVSDYKLLFIYNLAREQVPFEAGMNQYEYDIRVYEGLYRLTMKAKADDVKYIYAWMQKLIPLSVF